MFVFSEASLMSDSQLSTPSVSAGVDPNEQTAIPAVLIVEDALELAEILQLTLRRLKLRTAHESFGVKAAERFKELQPDIVLLDISLPDIPGWQVLESIKQSSEVLGLRMPMVIVITAFGDPANRLIGKLQGVYRYLIKPFTPREVEQIVREALSTRYT
jgi:DNA-binding response OmpR family regulator